MRRRLIIIGLDGVPYSLIKGLSERGVTPNFKLLIDRYNFKEIFSTVPEVSSVAWSSIITGKNPAEHSIFGFTDIAPLSYRVFFPNFTNIKERPFWKEREDLNYQIVNVPSTYPVSSLNGILISGFVSYDLEEAVYPKDLLGYLKDISYKIDVDSEKAHTSKGSFIEDMDKTITSRIRLFDYLWNSEWDVNMFVFTETDRLFHFLWDAYENERHKYHSYFLDFFKRIDSVIGKKISDLEDADTLIILSDHGFERLERDVYVNCFLKDKGILQNDSRFENMELCINSSTKAFSLDPARIYINSSDRFPCDGIDADKKEEIKKDLEEIFLSWKINDTKVISKIFLGEDIYRGVFKNLSPDLVLVPNKGFNLRSSFSARGLYSDGAPFTGKHTYEGAFMITNLDINFSNNFSVIDAGRMIKEEVLGL